MASNEELLCLCADIWNTLILTDPIVTDKKFKTKWNLLRANGSKHELLELKKIGTKWNKLQTKENKGKKVKIRLKEFDSQHTGIWNITYVIFKVKDFTISFNLFKVLTDIVHGMAYM